MNHLKELGYVKYRPSYHPVEGSEVSLLGFTTFTANDHDLNQDSSSLHQTLDEVKANLDQDGHDLDKGDKSTLSTNPMTLSRP
jgi:hypothetical protein